MHKGREGVGRLARTAAEAVLREGGESLDSESEGGRVAIDVICESLGVEIVADREFGSRGEFWALEEEGLGGSSIHLQPGLDWETRRFVLAHELGHWYVRKRMDGFLAKEVEEAFCNEFAGEILVPRRLLEQWARSLNRDYDGAICLAAILEGSSRAGVGHFVFVRRLMLSKIVQRIDPRGMVLIARVGVARKTKEGRALRVEAVSPPQGLFVPTNRRLRSIGLGSLEVGFREMDHLEERRYVGEVEAINLARGWRSLRVGCGVQYMKFGRSGWRDYLLVAGRVDKGWSGLGGGRCGA